MKISDQTLKMLNELPQATREKVDEVVCAYVAACRKMDAPIENLDRVYIEAVEIVKLEEICPETRFEVRNWEPMRRYDQYTSPKN